MTAYYNEIDPYAAEWLRNLIAAGHIAPGVVDTRSIEDVHPADLKDFTQCHFFAGIGGWSLALRRAGWPDDRPIWTGSCPCQPFSSAGEGAGFADERHLWPAFYHLVCERRPAVLGGEQVASKDADAWIDLVQADMEALDYAFGSVAFPSASVGAPHIRDRNYWLAYSNSSTGRKGRAHVRGRLAGGDADQRPGSRGGIVLGGLADANGWHASAEWQQRGGEQRQQQENGRCGVVEPGAMANACGERREGERLHIQPGQQGSPRIETGRRREAVGPGPTNGFWSDADWIFCRDAKWRPVEAGTFPLADGLPAGLGPMRPWVRSLAGMAGLDGASLRLAKSYRVGALHGYGNAINPEQAAEFMRIVMEVTP